jgi:L-iditol 2-dehydrogenase
VSVAVHAVERTPVSLGDTAVVVGAGTIGLLVVQALRLAGCGNIIAVDLDEERLKLARRLGADLSLKADGCNVSEEVKHCTGGRGADLAMEAVGTSPSLNSAVACVRKGGALTLVGNLITRSSDYGRRRQKDGGNLHGPLSFPARSETH